MNECMINIKQENRKIKIKGRKIKRFLAYLENQKKRKIKKCIKQKPIKQSKKRKFKFHSISPFEEYILKKTLCNRYNIVSDTFDFFARIDKTLTYSENLQELEDNYFSPKISIINMM